MSLSGIVTFKGARAIQDVAAWAPLDRLLVETDSPFLAPVPMRGKRCEPAFVVHTARYVADLRACRPMRSAERPWPTPSADSASPSPDSPIEPPRWRPNR